MRLARLFRVEPSRYPAPTPRSRFRSRRSERGLHALVQREQVLDAFTLRRETLPAVETIHSAIQRLMRPAEVGRHQVRVVQVCQRRARVGGASVEDGLRERLQRRRVRVREAGEIARPVELPRVEQRLAHGGVEVPYAYRVSEQIVVHVGFLTP